MAGLLLLTLATIGINPDSAAALADLKQFPVSEQGHYAYATVSDRPDAASKQRTAETLAFVCCSLSHKSYLGDQIPQRVAGTDLYRLDLRGLGWERVWAGVLKQHYVPKYRPDLQLTHQYPLVVSALWMATALPDTRESGDSQYLLLYGFVPKTGADFRRFWEVNTKIEDTYGFLEGKSRVQAKNAQRLMENYGTAKRASHFGTKDSKKVAGKTSPSENLLPGTLKFDGQELLNGIPKHYGKEGGQALACFLGNGNTDPDVKKHDTKVDDAPIDLVEDYLNLRGSFIGNTYDCWNCHTKGMQDPFVNEYEETIKNGHRIYADKKSKAEIERFYESPFGREIKRFDEDYATFMRLCNGLTPERNASQFAACIKAYDADLDLPQAARESYLTVDQLRFALAEYSPYLTDALAGLAHGKPVTRDEWVESQPLLQLKIIPAWRAKK